MIDQGGFLRGSAEQRRHTTRHKMFEPVTLRIGKAKMRGHFLDLSCSGALAHCETPPMTGAYVAVEALGLQTSGRVMWVRGKRFGIQFSQPLDNEAMTVLIRGV